MTIVDRPPLAFTDADLAAAYEAWGCNCGPSALAACLGWTLDAVRPHLGDFDRRRYMNPPMMHEAILGCGYRIIESASAGRVVHGIIRVQWCGPWTAPGANPKWASIHTHWIAHKIVDGCAWVYDVNAGWATYPEWRRETVPRIVDSIERADGEYFPTHAWEVRRLPCSNVKR